MKNYEFVDKMRSFDRFFANLLSKFDNLFYGDLFTIVEANVVSEIYKNQTMTATEISTKLNINKGQLSKIINRLVKTQVILRVANDQDKRAYLLTLSENGKKMYEEQRQVVRDGLLHETSVFSKGEKDRLEQAMTSFINTYQKQNTWEIVEVTSQDIGFVADLHSRVYTNLGYDLTLQQHILTSLLSYTKQPQSGKIWVAKVNNQRVGSIGIVQTNEHLWEVHWFAVDENYQGLGIGQKLLDQLMDYLEEQQIEQVFLWTINELVAARNLYTKYGFTLTESRPNKTWKSDEVIDEKWEWHPVHKS